MAIFDPRLGLIAAGAAVVGSERVRRTVGRGAGYAIKVATPVAKPVVDAGRDILDEARDVAGSGNGRARGSRSRSASKR